MTPEQLKQCDGRDGRPAYIAVNGTIYDVSASTRWQGGNHEGAHQAGADLTEELKQAPHVRSVIERFPVVGRLADDQPPAPASQTTYFKWVGIIGAILFVLLFILLKK